MNKEAREDRSSLDPADQVRKSEYWPTSLRWPAVVDVRLKRLVELANEAGGNVHRADVLGALVADAKLDGGAIRDLVTSYWTRTVGELHPDLERPDGVIPLQGRTPGRPAQRRKLR